MKVEEQDDVYCPVLVAAIMIFTLVSADSVKWRDGKKAYSNLLKPNLVCVVTLFNICNAYLYLISWWSFKEISGNCWQLNSKLLLQNSFMKKRLGSKGWDPVLPKDWRLIRSFPPPVWFVNVVCSLKERRQTKKVDTFSNFLKSLLA